MISAEAAAFKGFLTFLTTEDSRSLWIVVSFLRFPTNDFILLSLCPSVLSCTAANVAETGDRSHIFTAHTSRLSNIILAHFFSSQRCFINCQDVEKVLL